MGTQEVEVMDASEAADYAALQEMAGDEKGAPGAEPVAEVSPVDRVEALFRPAFMLLAGVGPKNAAFYTEGRAREAARVFVPLAEAEGWNLEGLEGKWALRVAFLMVVTPPHAVEWVVGKVMAFAAPKEPEPEKVEGQGAAGENK